MTVQATLTRVVSIVLMASAVACSGRPAAQAAATALKPLAVTHDAAVAPAPSRTDGTVTKPGITTIAAVWKDRAARAGTTITVRGKIVKYNGGILGVNWMHLQDGSGSAADGSNDLTITSETEAHVGDEITATGTLVINRDIGSGYQYGAIIERARVVKP
jgi:hypothetical protein